jgi:hypothetical protein
MSIPSTTRAQAIDRLRKDFGVKAGSTIYTTVKHVSRSGMSRTIACYVSHKGNIHDVSALVATAIGARFDRDRGGVIMTGCGMDMTFATVYNLSRSMWPNGHKCNGIESGKHRCPSNDHSNDYGQARRIARDELKAENRDVDAYTSDPGERERQFRDLNERAELVAERDGLTYRKGRKHSDGGYVLNRGSL